MEIEVKIKNSTGYFQTDNFQTEKQLKYPENFRRNTEKMQNEKKIEKIKNLIMFLDFSLFFIIYVGKRIEKS